MFGCSNSPDDSAQKSRDAKLAREKQQALDDAANEAAQALQNDFADKQRRLQEQEHALKKVVFLSIFQRFCFLDLF